MKCTHTYVHLKAEENGMHLLQPPTKGGTSASAPLKYAAG